ncbi:MAG: 5-oxoprolinase subunit PxpB [Saprospiraceae bacterium]
MKESLLIKPYNVIIRNIDEGYLLLQWPDQIDTNVNDAIINVATNLREITNNHILDIIPAYCSLTVIYDYKMTTIINIIDLIKKINYKRGVKPLKIVKEIQVCYDPEFSLDMDVLCKFHNLSRGEVIALHSIINYKISFIGFLPGFMYLSGLPTKLSTPRRANPRQKVPVGAVAIGGNQTGIYPQSSPGGWHIIGRCPLVLFDIHKSSPCRFEAGENIKMKPVTKSEYWEIYNTETR